MNCKMQEIFFYNIVDTQKLHNVVVLRVLPLNTIICDVFNMCIHVLDNSILLFQYMNGVTKKLLNRTFCFSKEKTTIQISIYRQFA